MKPVMGMAVGRATVRAVLVQDRAIRWAGAAAYADLDDLVEAIGRIAGEGNGVGRPHRVRVVLERPVVQVRTVVPAPPLGETAARRWVSLEAPRLFRKNGAALLTDARIVQLSKASRALVAGAVAEPQVRAILQGCAAAGLPVPVVGVAADVVAQATTTNGKSHAVVRRTAEGTETIDVAGGAAWRSRWVRTSGAGEATSWAPALLQLGEQAEAFAAAYGAAVGNPALVLLPAEVRAERDRHVRRRVSTLALTGMGLWLAAGAVHVLRLSATVSSSTQFLDAVRSSVDSALALRSELRAAQAALDVVARTERGRSQQLALLGAVTDAMPDAAYLVTFRVTPDGVVRLAGYAPMAARALAALERVQSLREVRFEGPVGREAVQGVGERDRFAIVARVAAAP